MTIAAMDRELIPKSQIALGKHIDEVELPSKPADYISPRMRDKKRSTMKVFSTSPSGLPISGSKAKLDFLGKTEEFQKNANGYQLEYELVKK